MSELDWWPMSPILYRLRQSLRRWVATAGLSFVVAVLLGLVLTLVAGAHRTSTAPDRYANAFGGGYDVAIDQPHSEPTPEVLAALPGIEALSSVTFVFGILTPRGADEPVDALVFAGEKEAVAGTNVIEGRPPAAGSVDEILVSNSFLAQTGARLGDSFELSSLTQEQAAAFAFDTPDPGGPTTTATVVGVFGGAAELQEGYVIALFSPALLDLADIGLGGRSSAGTLVPGTTFDGLRAQIDTLPNAADLTISAVDWVPDSVRSAVQTQAQGLAVLALFAGVAAVAVIGQVLGRQHRLSEAERLALRTIGMTPRQLLADPLSRAAVPIVAGSIGSTVAALAYSARFPTGFVKQIEPQPGVRFDPLVHVVGPFLLALLLLGWVAAGFAMSDRPRTPLATAPFVDGVASRFRRVEFATGVRFAFSGTRDRRWPASSFAGLMIVLGVAVGALTLGANITRLVDEPAEWGSAPFSIGSGGDDLPDNVRTLLATDPDVAAVTYYGAVSATVGTDSLFIVGMQPARGDLLPPVLSGRLPQSDDEIVLGTVDARTLDLGIGDEFHVSTNAGVERLRVTGLAVIPSVNQGDGIGEGGVVTLGGLHRLDPAAPLNIAGLEFREGSVVETGARVSRIARMAIHEAQPTTEIVNIDRIRSIPMLVAAVLGAFALLSLTHQLIVSARQRRRDVGILKALGADRRGVSRVVHVQATVYTLAVIAVATPIGAVAGQLVYRVITDGIGASGDAILSWPALATAIIAPVTLANLVAVIPARRARNVRPSLHLNQE